MTAQRPPRPLLSAVRPFTVRMINPLTRRFAGRLPGFGIISYRGRTSGKTYDTPMNVFRGGEDFVFALTYGSDVQWVKNVLATGRAELRTRNTTVPLTDPVLFVDPARRLMPQPVRMFLGLQGVTEFLRMRPLTSGGGSGDRTADAGLEAR